MTDKNVINSDWSTEIIRETEHYYLGEQRQEERLSWLLGSSSAIIALIIGGVFSLGANNEYTFTTGIIIFVILSLLLFFVSAVFAILGLLPLSGLSLSSPKWCKEKISSYKNMSPKALVMTNFNINQSSNDSNTIDWVIHHFKMHYLRNLKKSINVVWASIFLGFGLFSLFILIIIQIFA